MYLTRFQINPARRGARELLGSPQRLHAAVLAAFPQTADERGRVLWRVDRDEHRTWLYLVSRTEPDLTHVVEQAGWPATQAGWDTRPYGALLSRLADGQRWAFRLTANPTRTTSAHGSVRHPQDRPAELDPRGRPKARRYGHVTVDQQLEWLRARVDGWGFALPEGDTGGVVVHGRETVRFRRDERTVTIARASFDGVLEVTDVGLLRDVLTTGAGPAKAYGCGLLTLAPLG